jgi:restriction endonuclease BglII
MLLSSSKKTIFLSSIHLITGHCADTTQAHRIHSSETAWSALLASELIRAAQNPIGLHFVSLEMTPPSYAQTVESPRLFGYTAATMLNKLKERKYEVQFESHATAILDRDFPAALTDIESALADFEVPITEIIGSGGGISKGTQRLRRSLTDLGWPFVNYEIKKTINGIPRESISHEVDHVKAFKGDWKGEKEVALEIEWNNKDPFFDRDLENFKRLHAEGAISVGIVITRGTTLQDRMREFVARYATDQRVNSFEDLERLNIGLTSPQRKSLTKKFARSKDFAGSWVSVFTSSKFGQASTHWRKLMDRVSRGVGSPCPLLLIGLPAEIVTFDYSGGVQAASPEPEAAEAEEAELFEG